MADAPLFDPSLKKRKKKAVAFIEDPLGAEADPTQPAPETIDSTTLSGDAVDLGPKTAHEQMQEGAAKKQAVEVDVEGEMKSMFGDLKKKKKKKDIPMDLDETPPADGEVKKKKKKKDIPMDLGDEPAPADGDLAATEDTDFSDLKKKSSKKKKSNMEAFEKEFNDSSSKADSIKGAAEDEEDDDDDMPPPMREMDESELGENVFAQADAPAGIDTGAEAWLKSDRDYTYPELLSRFYTALHAANPALLNSGSRKYTIAPPSIHREGNKKSIFANVADICKKMHRQPEHVIQFLFSEMGTTGSVDGAGRLVIKGRFQQKQVENVLRRYIVEYVTCKTCRSPDTLLTKETRIFFITCESCGSKRSVNAIKSGFQAQVGKRSKNKVA